MEFYCFQTLAPKMRVVCSIELGRMYLVIFFLSMPIYSKSCLYCAVVSVIISFGFEWFDIFDKINLIEKRINFFLIVVNFGSIDAAAAV